MTIVRKNSTIFDGCLGPFNRTLSNGDVQSMVFEEHHDGPWWITSREGREARRLDILHAAPTDGATTTKLTNRTKLQLAIALRDEAGITVDPLRPMNEIKEFANRHGVDLHQYQKAHIKEGWLGESKGLLQILWERGWINPCKCATFKQDKTAGKIVNTSLYTINGRKDAQTGQILATSLITNLATNEDDPTRTGDPDAFVNIAKRQQLLYSKEIERLMKKFKTH